ncbi:beta strand repeat-containing protein, partial [Flavobacterium sp. W21_SRS_FM6]|uniref:beta strand repeat-containing protein n=1 Tax=Flavobacterium sp. W21_SRS_FM6 TaxID=3240268 RepID=UPI003F8E2A88
MSQIVLVTNEQAAVSIPLNLSSVLTVGVRPGVTYGLMDVETGTYPLKARTKQNDDDMEVLIDDQIVLVIKDFYAEDSGADFDTNGDITSTPHIIGSNEPLSETGADAQTGWTAQTGLAEGGDQHETLWGAGIAALIVGSAISSSNQSAANDYSLSISGTAGYLNSIALVTVYDTSGNVLVTEEHDFSQGPYVYSLNDSYVGTLLVSVTDINGDAGDYTDETSGENTSLNTTLRAMVTSDGSSDISVNITPLTELAAQLAGVGVANSVSESQLAFNATVAALFGLEDILGAAITVTDSGFDNSDGISAAEAYGVVLASLSGADSASGGLSNTLMQLFAEVTVTNDGRVAITQDGLDIINAGVAAYNASEAGLVNAIVSNVLSAPVISKASGGLTRQEVDAGIIITIATANVGDEVIIDWGGVSFSYMVKDEDLNANGTATFSMPTDVIAEAGDGTVTVSYVVGGQTSGGVIINVNINAPGAPNFVLATDTGSSHIDGITQDATVDVTLASDAASWQYSTDGGSTWTTGTGTSFELAADTSYAIADIQVKQTDTAGNTSAVASNAAAITVDNTLAAPGLALTTDTGSSDSDGITTDATVNVILAADVASWQYSLDGGANWTTGNGTSFELSANTTYAIADIQVKQTDVAGNESAIASNAATITTDTTLAAPSLALATDTGSSNSDGITTDATVDVTLDTDVASWQYSLNGGSTWTTGSGTSFELAANTTYAIGDIQVKQTDTAGNTSAVASNAAVITVDNILAAPSLALTTDTGSSDSDGITTDATVNVTLAADVASWQYSLNGGSTWTTGSGTSFELADDTFYAISDVQVKQTDTAGNISSAVSNTAAITVDNTVAPPSLALATDTGSSSSDGITTDATVNVTGLEIGTTWQFSLDGGVNWATGSGTSFELAADTTYAIGSIQVKQTDAAGNASATTSSTAAISVDNTLDDDYDLAITPLDTLLNASDVSAVSVTLSGIDADAQSVVVSFNKDLSLNETVNATYENGVWSAPAIDLSDWSDGEISYAVIVTDIAGNSKVVGVFDDTTLNIVITENGVSFDPNGLGANAESIKVTIADADNSTDDVVINAIKTEGTWAFPDADLSGLSGTTRTLSIEIINLDGSLLTQVINNILPAITLDTVVATPSLALATDSGSSSSDGITNDATVNVSGLEAGATWQYSLDGGVNWATGTGTSFELGADATYAIGDIQVKQTDVAGNASSAASNAAAITTDTTLAAPSLALATDTGSSNSDGITTDATVNVTLADDVASWQYSTDGGSNWTTGTGTSFELAEDTFYAIADIQVKQTDTAGNTSSAASNAAAITTDTTLAAPSLALATDTGESDSDGITTDATVDVTLATDVASWQYSLDGGANWLDGSGTSFELAEDTFYAIADIQVKQTDTAGNTSSAASNAAAITTDTTLAAPSLALATDTGESDSDGITTDATVDVTLATDVASWQYSLDGGANWLDGSGTSFELA